MFILKKIFGQGGIACPAPCWPLLLWNHFCTQVFLQPPLWLTLLSPLIWSSSLSNWSTVQSHHQHAWPGFASLWSWSRDRDYWLQVYRHWLLGKTFTKKTPVSGLTQIPNTKYHNPAPPLNLGKLIFFSCPKQLNRWPCHWLTHSLREAPPKMSPGSKGHCP